MQLPNGRFRSIKKFKKTRWGDDDEYEWYYPIDDLGFVYEKEHDRDKLRYIRIQCEEVPEGAFHRCRNLMGVIMDDEVIKIGDGPFEDCDSLSYVKLSPRIQYIGRSAFRCCSSLQSIFIPPACTFVDDHAFYGCSSLSILAMSSEIKLGRKVVWGCKKLLMNSKFDVEYEDIHSALINKWLLTCMDRMPLHSLCASMTLRALQLHNLLRALGPDSGLQTNYQGMNALHILMANPYFTCHDEAILETYLKSCSKAGTMKDQHGVIPLQYLIFNSFGCSTKMVQAYLNRCIVPDNIKDDALAASHKIVNYVPEAVMRSVADIYEKSCPGVDLYGLQLITASHLGICAKEQHKCSS
jgi:hypothetical protein